MLFALQVALLLILIPEIVPKSVSLEIPDFSPEIANFVLHPIDTEYISGGFHAGNFLITDRGGDVLIVDGHGTGEIVWQTEFSTYGSNYSNPRVYDATINGHGTVFIADYINDRVVAVNPQDGNNSSVVQWIWDARNTSHLNFTQLGQADIWGKNAWGQEAWGQDAYNIIANQSQLDTARVGIMSVEFINGTLLGRAYDSLLLTLRNIDMIVEIKFDESRALIWYYGIPGRSKFLSHPTSASKSSGNGNIIVSDAGNSRIAEIYYPYSSLIWRYGLKFPEGSLREPMGCTAINHSLFVISDTFNGQLLIFNKSMKIMITQNFHITFNNFSYIISS